MDLLNRHHLVTATCLSSEDFFEFQEKSTKFYSNWALVKDRVRIRMDQEEVGLSSLLFTLAFLLQQFLLELILRKTWSIS